MGEQVCMTENVKVISIKKHFPGVEVLKGVSFSLDKGKIYGLVGENGALFPQGAALHPHQNSGSAARIPFSRCSPLFLAKGEWSAS